MYFDSSKITSFFSHIRIVKVLPPPWLLKLCVCVCVCVCGWVCVCVWGGGG